MPGRIRSVRQYSYAFCAWMVLLGLFFALPSPVSAQTVINANDRGWYNNGGTHNPGNNNTFTGQFNGTTYRSYFRFTIPAGITCLATATLEIEIENYYGGGAAHTANFYDVNAVNVPLLDTVNGSGSGAAIHIDLGTGTLYGSQGGLTSADIGSVLTFTLPAAALTDIIGASGSDFAVGSNTAPGGGGALRALRYSGGSEARVHRLTLTECPDFAAAKTMAVHDPGALGLYAIPGNDVVYTISVTNNGNGTSDVDTFELIDAFPGDLSFYNGDIDDAGPETNPVAFVDAASGLTFTYGADVKFSDAVVKPVNFAACSLTTALSAGYNSHVTFICLNPKGVFGAGDPDPAMSLSFRARID